MATFPPSLHPSKRDRSLITIGVVVAVLLVGLLALPFLARTQNGSRRHTMSAAGAAQTNQAIAR